MIVFITRHNNFPILKKLYDNCSIAVTYEKKIYYKNGKYINNI